MEYYGMMFVGSVGAAGFEIRFLEDLSTIMFYG